MTRAQRIIVPAVFLAVVSAFGGAIIVALGWVAVLWLAVVLSAGAVIGCLIAACCPPRVKAPTAHQPIIRCRPDRDIALIELEALYKLESHEVKQ